MSADRAALRADLRAAIATVQAAHAPLTGARLISAWAQSLDPKSLPAIGVATPAETHEAIAQDTVELRLTAVVVVKRLEPNGDDGTALEDALDADAAALIEGLEQAVVLRARNFECQSAAIDVSGTGSPRVGTLTLTFGATVWRARNNP